MKKNKPLFFTKHQLKRMAQRGISKAMIQVVVNNGEWERGGEPFSFKVEYKGVIAVLYEKKTQYNVGTCMLNREYTLKVVSLKEELGIDFLKAMHKIVKQIDFTDEIAQLG